MLRDRETCLICIRNKSSIWQDRVMLLHTAKTKINALQRWIVHRSRQELKEQIRSVPLHLRFSPRYREKLFYLLPSPTCPTSLSNDSVQSVAIDLYFDHVSFFLFLNVLQRIITVEISPNEASGWRPFPSFLPLNLADPNSPCNIRALIQIWSNLSSVIAMRVLLMHNRKNDGGSLYG